MISDNELDIVPSEDKFLKKYNNIYITDYQVNILKKYGIDVKEYNDLNELIYTIEKILNNSIDDLTDLDYVSETLSEYNYYNNINK